MSVMGPDMTACGMMIPDMSGGTDLGQVLTPAGVNCILLPVHPTAMISIPIIKSAIPKKRDTNTAPAYGDAIIKKDKAMAKAPAPMLNPLAQPGLSLLLTPFTTWEIPANSKPMPNIIITNTAVCTGYPTAIEPKMRANTPRPTVPQRDLFFTNIPLIIFSIPTMIKIMPAKYTIETTVMPG
jgi:hypothetical protein